MTETEAATARTADPAMFSGMTAGELAILNHHLTSGWYKQGAVYPALSEPWWDTNWLLRDLHEAHMAAIRAEQRSRRGAGPAATIAPECPDHNRAYEYERSEGQQERWACPEGGCTQGEWIS